MGAPVSAMESIDDSSAESLLTSFKTIPASERRRHATVLNYWQSIRGDRDFPPIQDFNALEISDAGPNSVLLELIGGGEDAEIRHFGEAIKGGLDIERIAEAPRPSFLASIANKLGIVAISRNFLAFEDELAGDGGTTRCWITLLPFSSTGAWVDYVYGFITLETPETVEHAADASAIEEPPENPLELDDPADDPPAQVEASPKALASEVDEAGALPADVEQDHKSEDAPAGPDEAAPPSDAGQPGFSSKVIDSLVKGIFSPAVHVEAKPKAADEKAQPQAEEPAEQPIESNPTTEGDLQSKLAEVRAKADEARQAKLRSEAALHEGLSAAYDFALDAEGSADEYLKLVEAQGLKIQLRSPMAPVVKLAFDGLTDEATIGELERVLAWALKADLPRGSLAAKIEAAGGIAPLLNGEAQAA